MQLLSGCTAGAELLLLLGDDKLQRRGDFCTAGGKRKALQRHGSAAGGAGGEGCGSSQNKHQEQRHKITAALSCEAGKGAGVED